MNVSVPIDEYEHLLNCLCNQKYIHEMKPSVQKEWQKIMDEAWRKGMDRLCAAQSGSRGGVKRMQSLSSTQKTELAKSAAEARWSKKRK